MDNIRLISKYLNYTPSGFRNLLNRNRRPRYQTAIELEKLSGVSVDTWILGTSDELRAALTESFPPGTLVEIGGTVKRRRIA